MELEKSTAKKVIAPPDHKIFPLFMRMKKSQHKKSLSDKRRRRGQKKFVSFEDAKAMVRRANIQSRRLFWEWHDHNKIGYIPRMPHHTYKDDWVSWNDFLGVNNVWEANGYQPGNYRPYWEAVRWAQAIAVKNDVKTMKEWLAWYGENKDSIPDNIPKRPDAYYDEWAGWGTWLGTTIKGNIMTAEKANGILALVVQKGHANNVITMRMERGGASALEAAWLDAKEIGQEFKVVKMFAYEPEKLEQLQGVYRMLSTAYEGNEQVRLVQNLPTFLWEIESIFDVVT